MPTFSEPIAQTAAVVVSIAFSVIAGFMAHWSLGRTWGLSAHWGGVYRELPVHLRIADALSFCVFVFGAYAVIGRAWSLDKLGSEALFNWSAWGFVALLGLSGVMNLASSSKIERYWLGPLATLLAILCFVVARSEWSGL